MLQTTTTSPSYSAVVQHNPCRQPPRIATGSAGVASGHPLAAQAGVDALRAGGTAVDAGLAAAFTQWIVNAPQSGPGGEMLVLVAAPDEVSVDVFAGWSRVPLHLDEVAPEWAPSAVNGWPPTNGPHNAVVPGSLRGAEAAWRARGRLGWSELFSHAIAASQGHEVTASMARFYRRVRQRGHVEAMRRVIGSTNPPKPGSTIRLPALGATLKRISTNGPDDFYRGEIARRLVAAAKREGAALRHDDLESVEAVTEKAAHRSLGDIKMWVPADPSQAPITMDLLAEVPSHIDPASRAFARIVARITDQQLTNFCKDGPRRPEGTAVSTAVDASGVSATVVHSLAGVQFGTGWVAGDTGVALSNRVGTALSERDDLPGSNPSPGAVLPHTLSAAHVRGGGRWMTAATPGGDRQVQWLAQAVQRFRCGADAAEIVAEPRWFVCPSGDRFGVPSGIGEPWIAFGEPGVEWYDDPDIGGYATSHIDNVGGGLQIATGATGAGDTPQRAPVERFTLASDPRSGGTAIAVEQKP